MKTKIPARYHRIDGWRGYSIPGCAVAGASDTGMFSDSPCPSNLVRAEIKRFRDECLKPAGFKSRVRFGNSSNVFCAKRWVCVAPDEWAAAKKLADEWIEKTKNETRFIHEAD